MNDRVINISFRLCSLTIWGSNSHCTVNYVALENDIISVRFIFFIDNKKNI